MKPATSLTPTYPTIIIFAHLAMHLRAAAILFGQCMTSRTIADICRAFAANPLAQVSVIMLILTFTCVTFLTSLANFQITFRTRHLLLFFKISDVNNLFATWSDAENKIFVLHYLIRQTKSLIFLINFITDNLFQFILGNFLSTANIWALDISMSELILDEAAVCFF